MENGKGRVLVNGNWVTVYRGFRDKGIEFYETGSFKSGYFSLPVGINIKGQLIKVVNQTYFFDNGALAFSQLSEDASFEIQSRSIKFQAKPMPIEFYPSGQIRCGYLSNKELLSTVPDGRLVDYSYSVYFNKNCLVDQNLRFTDKYF